MDQGKIGAFIRELRKENNLTQEQMAARFGVSRRTVSRWETGSNLPDLDLLIEISDAFQVDLRDLLEGERRKEPSKKTDPELEETVLKVADYSSEEKQKLNRRLNRIFCIGLIVSLLYLVLLFTEKTDGAVGSSLTGFCQGITAGTMIAGVLMTSRYASRIRAFKLRLIRKISGAK